MTLPCSRDAAPHIPIVSEENRQVAFETRKVRLLAAAFCWLAGLAAILYCAAAAAASFAASPFAASGHGACRAPPCVPPCVNITITITTPIKPPHYCSPALHCHLQGYQHNFHLQQRYRVLPPAGLPVQLVRGPLGRHQRVSEAQRPVHSQHCAAARRHPRAGGGGGARGCELSPASFSFSFPCLPARLPASPVCLPACSAAEVLVGCC